MTPLRQADLSLVEALFTDVDGTMTTDGRLTSKVIQNLELASEHGLRVVLVTGRPAGFAEAWLRAFPVEAVIAENGGLYFTWAGARLKKVYARPASKRIPERARLHREVRAVLRRFPRLRLSTDSAFTEVDLALDYNEEIHLGPAVAEAVIAQLRRRGVSAVRSSVHVNCWLGSFDKAKTVEQFLRREWKTGLQPNDRRFAYLGDSLNDAPLFARFPLSVGVANVREVLAELPVAPRYVTQRPEGHGFAELVRAILSARGKVR